MSTRKVAILAALSAVTVLAGASGAGAGSLGRTKTTQITFDGNCDGMAITVFSWHQAGTASTGCDPNRIGAGLVGNVKNFAGKDLTIGENPGDLATTLGEVWIWNIQYPLATGKTWSAYSSTDGFNFTFQGSGTYTVVGAGEHPIHAGLPAGFRRRK